MRQKLTELAVKNAKAVGKPRKLADANGLYLHVEPTGAKYWRYRYRSLDGREKVVSLGVYPVLSLAAARKKHADARTQVASGGDPVEHKRAIKLAAQVAAANSFESIARAWHARKKGDWKNEKNAVSVLRRMEQHLFPSLGRKPVTEVTARMVLDTVKRIEAAGTLETARRCLQYADAALRYAVVHGHVSHVVTHALGRDALTAAPARNHPRVKPEEIGAVLRAVDAADLRPATRLCLALVFQTAVRSGEARGARWSEFDLDQARWTIPAERMKMANAHIVPLSKQAIATLRELQQHTGDCELLFPNQSQPLKPMSENAMQYALNRAGYAGRQTVHGIRGLFSTTANESGQWDGDVIELCLAHNVGGSVRRAYNSSQRLPDRAKLMQWWADQLDSARAGATIIEFRKAV
jgi:integrase